MLYEYLLSRQKLPAVCSHYNVRKYGPSQLTSTNVRVNTRQWNVFSNWQYWQRNFATLYCILPGEVQLKTAKQRFNPYAVKMSSNRLIEQFLSKYVPQYLSYLKIMLVSLFRLIVEMFIYD